MRVSLLLESLEQQIEISGIALMEGDGSGSACLAMGEFSL